MLLQALIELYRAPVSNESLHHGMRKVLALVMAAPSNNGGARLESRMQLSSVPRSDVGQILLCGYAYDAQKCTLISLCNYR
jgi:hypothetical protein